MQHKAFSSASAVPSFYHSRSSLFCFMLLLFSLILPRLNQSASCIQDKRSHTLRTFIFLYVSSLMSKYSHSYISIFGKSTTQFPDVTNMVDDSCCSLLGSVLILYSLLPAKDWASIVTLARMVSKTWDIFNQTLALHRPGQIFLRTTLILKE